MHRIQFNIRHDDIEEFIILLQYLNSIEPHKEYKFPSTDLVKKLEITTTHQKCLRAQFILMLYNLIESTVVENMLHVFDAISDEGLYYHELSEQIKDEWLNSLIPQDGTKKTYWNKTKEILSKIDSEIIFPTEIKRFNGNVDLKKIIEVYGAIGIQFGKIPNSKEIAEILLKIKSVRNDLAHGNKSYSQVGSSVTMTELINYKVKTVTFLKFFIEKIEAFITSKSYHK